MSLGGSLIKNIPVTMPYLPDLKDVTTLLETIWKNGILTHNGPIVQQFEDELAKALGLKHIAAVTNGTIAIQMAIKALEIKGEIITTPFTWIASISAIKWEGCTPVFCDIDPDTLNIDPDKIEQLITDKTVAIMPVHVFGNPCNVDAIEKIAGKYKLKVIYDAAHAVGTVYKEKSIMNYGDISATSFHATKIINTAEGGACVTNSPDLHEKIKRIRFFGYDEQKEIVEDGFNGKMTEVHAALGLLNVRNFQLILADRKTKYLLYKEMLSEIPNVKFQAFKVNEPNYSYFPIIFPTEKITLQVMDVLNLQGIYPRRYFYPSVNTYTKILQYQPCPISEDISTRILCLPLYYTLSQEDIKTICDLVKQAIGH